MSSIMWFSARLFLEETSSCVLLHVDHAKTYVISLVLLKLNVGKNARGKNAIGKNVRGKNVIGKNVRGVNSAHPVKKE